MSLDALGWTDAVAARWRAVAPEGAEAARVVRTSRRFTYATAGDEVVVAMAGRGVEPAPVVGDWVALEHTDSGADRVVGVAERHSQLTRADPDGSGTVQVLAANVDLAVVVAGLDRPLSPARLERSLVLVWDSGAEPLVVLTKADQLDGAALGTARDEIQALAEGVEVITSGTDDDAGLDRLRELIPPGRTGVLLGESGAGKSTLVNRLCGAEVARTAEVRSTDAKGRHTTVTRELVVLPHGGLLIDAPGLRSLGLLDADDGLAATYPEIDRLAEHCRFRDCAHDHEPGCAVHGAVEAGELDAERVERWRAMYDEVSASPQSPTTRRRP